MATYFTPTVNDKSTPLDFHDLSDLGLNITGLLSVEHGTEALPFH